MDINSELISGFKTAFIDGNVRSNVAYKPQFISNDYTLGKKVLSSIEDELMSCDEFVFSVAFITMGGIEPLLQVLKELEIKGVKGRILTTDYLCFSEPKAIRKLSELKNIEIKIYTTNNLGFGFHTKGYIFRFGDIYKIIVGSSNITRDALTVNKEWNTKLVSTQNGEYTNDILSEFNGLWNSPNAKSLFEYLYVYEEKFNVVKKQRELALKQDHFNFDDYKLTPNDMQMEFISNIKQIVSENKSKALLISATGTGKTYASAFAIRELNPNRILFVVHREQIAKQAIQSYKRIFKNTKSFGLLSGNSKDHDTDFLFSTMQTMSKNEVFNSFNKDDFDIVVIDEAHRTGAESYKKIMNYFKPSLWIGMTASPERTDDFDVFSAFDHNIACEIRLQSALESDLLCPFHYFGITDIEVNGEVIDENTSFSNLTSSERVRNIIEKIEYYGYSGDRVKGLVFCRTKDEAKLLSDKFNTYGYRTISLTGESSQEDRQNAIERLASSENREDNLDYIFTVDIFNEGVDIPEINQVVMLRPTKSPIIFVQQLGRGLRKATDKEFVVVLDFIGNYENNFMIPIALSGDRTYNKDNIRHFVLEGERIIPGASTVHFDEISRKRIFSAIDRANFTSTDIIKKSYDNLKYKLGHIPCLEDFDKYGEMDPCLIFDNNTYGSYHNFLKKYEKDYSITYQDKEENILEFVSKKLANGKRINELELISELIENEEFTLNRYIDNLKDKYDVTLSENGIKSTINVLTNNFQSGVAKNTYKDSVLLTLNGDNTYSISKDFKDSLKNNDFKKSLCEVVNFGINRYKKDYSNSYENTNFVLYKKYTYEDVCRLLNWENNVVSLNIGGYKYDKMTKTFPVFINYDKEDNIQDTIKYEDHFVNNSTLIAISKSGRNIDSDDVQNFLHAKEKGVDVELFVRKNKDDKISKEFYYLGKMTASGNYKEFIMYNTNKSAVEIEWYLDTPVRDDIYNYIVRE